MSGCETWPPGSTARPTAEQIQQARDRVDALELELSLEEEDVARLEGGLSAVLARMLGNHEERLDRERAALSP